MKTSNLKKLLFTPLLFAGIAASAQNSNSITEASSIAVTKNTAITTGITKPGTFSDFTQQAPLFLKAKADEAVEKSFGFGIEPEALLPLGDFKNSTSVGIGLNFKALYYLGDGAITGTVGYNYFLPKEDVDFKYSGIPVKVGYLAKFDMFFVEPQIGIYSLRTSDEDGNSASNTNLLLAAKVGINIGKSSRLGAGYNYVKVTGGSYSFAGLSYLIGF